MWIYSGKLIWLPLVIVCFFIFVYKIKWQEAVLLILSMVLVGVLCDQSSASLIKPFFERLRPSHHPDFEYCVEIVKGYRGGRYGFVSSHAANGFGVVTFTSLLLRYRWHTIVIIFWALLTSYSRIYLGVHFISDIAGGMIVGVISGFIVYYVYLACRRYVLKVPSDQLKVSVISQQRAQILIATILGTILCIAIYSLFFDIPQ